MKRIAYTLFLTCFALTSCSGSESPTGAQKSLPYAYSDLTQRDHILMNLERACEERNLVEYERLLDDDFEFFFGPQDVQNNGAPTSWGKDRETNYAKNLLNRGFELPVVGGGSVDNVTLDFQYSEGEEEWFEIPAPDQNRYPNETWYEKTAEYSLTVVAGDITLTNSQPLLALFTVRLVDVDGEQQFRLIRWRDDILSAKAAVEESTWGRVKMLYEE